MYVIAVYDVASERTTKMLKLCRRYLNWIQNSVFEGELSELQLKELEAEARKIMQEDYDSFIIFNRLVGRPLLQVSRLQIRLDITLPGNPVNPVYSPKPVLLIKPVHS